MSLKDKYIKNEYRSLLDNVVQDFYIPLLNVTMSHFFVLLLYLSRGTYAREFAQFPKNFFYHVSSLKFQLC